MSVGKLTVVSGPTAVGKGTVIARILQQHPEIKLSVSATTRKPRPGEVEGVNYFFKSKEQFAAAIDNGQMLEYAQVHGDNFYGTLKQPVLDALQSGQNVLLEIDVQGARQIKQAFPQANLVFIAPPSWEELVHRLTGRGTESAAEQQKRLESAQLELEAQNEFDHIVINESVDECAAEVVNLMQ